MTIDEDRRRPGRGEPASSWGERTRRRLGATGDAQRFHAKPFLLGLSYGFALGFILEAILASHP